jgi:hypothetical protein
MAALYLNVIKDDLIPAMYLMITVQGAHSFVTSMPAKSFLVQTLVLLCYLVSFLDFFRIHFGWKKFNLICFSPLAPKTKRDTKNGVKRVGFLNGSTRVEESIALKVNIQITKSEFFYQVCCSHLSEESHFVSKQFLLLYLLGRLQINNKCKKKKTSCIHFNAFKFLISS